MYWQPTYTFICHTTTSKSLRIQIENHRLLHPRGTDPIVLLLMRNVKNQIKCYMKRE